MQLSLLNSLLSDLCACSLGGPEWLQRNVTIEGAVGGVGVGWLVCLVIQKRSSGRRKSQELTLRLINQKSVNLVQKYIQKS